MSLVQMAWETDLSSLGAAKSYSIWRDKSLIIPPLRGRADETVRKNVAWNESVTRIVGAKLHVSARSTFGRTNLFIDINQSRAVDLRWTYFEKSVIKTADVDVTGQLLNGVNVLDAIYQKSPVNPYRCEVIFTVELIITYEGKDPVVQPDYTKFLVPVLLASSLLIGALFIVKAVK